MTFSIITHVIHTKIGDKYFAYAPYVNEMNIWLKYADKIIIVAPLENFEVNSIHTFYNHLNIEFVPLKRFDFLKPIHALKAIRAIVSNYVTIFQTFKRTQHIHLRCPGNIGLIGCIAQICFPRVKKTAKYAGNWDPKAKQPLSYRLQKRILSNTLLTKNMQVLVYGEWPNQTKNIKPFFTATYSSVEIRDSRFEIRKLDKENQIRFLFVGSLVKGKQPIYAVELIRYLREKGLNVSLDLYGEGVERKKIEDYVQKNNLHDSVCLKGNQTKYTVLKAYQSAHFLILPSKSEGWPKVVAEAMFWGCLPVSTKVSCVPYMLDFGNRGLMLTMDLENDVNNLMELILNKESYQYKVGKAVQWSRKYTLDLFEEEIKKLLLPSVSK